MRYSLRYIVLALAVGGTLWQSACTTSLATTTADLLTSVSNELIRNYVNKFMGVESYSFGGLGT